jgi:tryptophan-rich sensory protein
MGLALASCTLQWFVSFGCIREFGWIDPSASWAMLPLQLWLTVATALNYDIWLKNPNHDGVGPFET